MKFSLSSSNHGLNVVVVGVAVGRGFIITSSAWKNRDRRAGIGRMIFPCDSWDFGVNGPPVVATGGRRLFELLAVANIAVVGLKVMEMYGVVEVVLGGGEGGMGGWGGEVVVSQLKTLDDFYGVRLEGS